MMPEGAGFEPRGGLRATEVDARTDALTVLRAESVPHLVAGAYALFEYTGILRDTKDLDIFLRRRDLERALRALERGGFRAELVDPGWIAKGYRGEWFVDLIFSSGNGVAVVDDGWFEHARNGNVMGVPVLFAPVEEMIWSKAYICERERYDGNDVALLLEARGGEMAWERLLDRFGPDWEVLFAHVVLFRFAFPSARTRVPDRVMRELLRRAAETVAEGDWPRPLCRGSLLSRTQYRHAIEQLGYEDARCQGDRGSPGSSNGEGVEDGAAVPPGSGR
ncbi:MAG TPA: hypothetical protein VMK12_09640 [Anaeromyxobacteraceae bacterium]|nr:hypothetical protein [Anaeromyxobacteraceae bacterium]